MVKYNIYIGLFLIVFGCNTASDNTELKPNTSDIKAPAILSYNVVASYPHNNESYTQGLIWENGYLIEGTGIAGESKLMKVNLKSGKSEGNVVKLPDDVFGEGVTILNGKIYQLTWQNRKVYVYDEKSFEKIKEFNWEHEGWGLTTDGKDLIVSTGESNMYIVDPESFTIKKTVVVHDNNGPVGNINELEYVNGFVFANIYLTDYIIKINLQTGEIVGKIDMTGLLEKFGQQVNKEQGLVLNGIAYDSVKHSFFITGKKWPLLFEVKLN